MKSKKNLLILLLCFLVLLLIVFTDNKKLSLTKSLGEKIISFSSKDEIDRIRIMGNIGSFDINKSSIFNEKSKYLARSDWVLREPLFVPADGAAVGSLINEIFNFSGERVEDDKIDPNKFSEYGIEPPSILLILNKGDYKEAFSLGEINDITHRFFVKRESDKKIFLVEDSFLKKLQEFLSKIRSDKVLSFNYQDVKRVDVLRQDLFYKLTSDCLTSSNWSVTSDGLELKADGNFIMKELRELSEIRVRKIYDNPADILKFTGLETPILIFKIEFKNDENNVQCSASGGNSNNEFIFQIGKGVGVSDKGIKGGLDSAYYLKIIGENVIYEIDKALIGDWMQSPDHFRLRIPFFDFAPNEFTSLEAIVPSLKCSIATEIEKVSSVKSIFDYYRNLELDMYIQQSELSNFEKNQGISFYFKNNKCIQGFEGVGLINQASVTGEKTPVAVVLRIKKCNEPDIFGTISLTNFKSLADSVTSMCN